MYNREGCEESGKIENKNKIGIKCNKFLYRLI